MPAIIYPHNNQLVRLSFSLTPILSGKDTSKSHSRGNTLRYFASNGLTGTKHTVRERLASKLEIKKTTGGVLVRVTLSHPVEAEAIDSHACNIAVVARPEADCFQRFLLSLALDGLET